MVTLDWHGAPSGSRTASCQGKVYGVAEWEFQALLAMRPFRGESEAFSRDRGVIAGAQYATILVRDIAPSRHWAESRAFIRRASTPIFKSEQNNCHMVLLIASRGSYIRRVRLISPSTKGFATSSL